MRIVIDLSDNSIVQPNQFIKSFRGEWARFKSATRVSIPGKSGKVTVKWTKDDNKDYKNVVNPNTDISGEYYDKVFNLCVIETDAITHFNNDLVDHWEKLGVNVQDVITSATYVQMVREDIVG